MSKDALKRFVNGGAPALIRHVFALVGMIGAVLVAGTLLYAEVKATGKKADENRERVEAIENKINKVTMQQQLLLQATDYESQLNKEFRKETGRALGEILVRLPRPSSGIRR